MTKTFRVYRGLFLTDVIWVGFMCGLTTYVLLNFSIPNLILERGAVKVVGALLFFTVLSVVSLLSFILHLSYRIKINDTYLKEYGFMSKKREIEIKSIQSINRDYYDWMDQLGGNVSKNQALSSFLWVVTYIYAFILIPFISQKGGSGGGSVGVSLPTFSLTISGEKFYFLHPVNPRMIEAIVLMNPNVEVDPTLADILPNKLRKKLGIKFSVTDKIGFWIWRILLSILFLFILFFLVLFIVALFKNFQF
jgi:hypothetical protein